MCLPLPYYLRGATQAEEYQDALALSNAVNSMRMNAPLDAAGLSDADLSPSRLGQHDDPYADSENESVGDFDGYGGYDRAFSPMAAYANSGDSPVHDK